MQVLTELLHCLFFFLLVILLEKENLHQGDVPEALLKFFRSKAYRFLLNCCVVVLYIFLYLGGSQDTPEAQLKISFKTHINCAMFYT